MTEMTREFWESHTDEIRARTAREREALVAAFIAQNPDIPISEIELIEERGPTITTQDRSARLSTRTVWTVRHRKGGRHG